MKCPYCHADLRYRERSNKTCSKCQRKFVLEPKDNVFRLHDLKLRDLINRLSKNGTLYITSEQVLGTNLPNQEDYKRGRFSSGCFSLILTFIIAILILIILLAILLGSDLTIIFFFIFFMFNCFIILFLSNRRFQVRQDFPSIGHFETTILRPWIEQYGKPPQLLLHTDTSALATALPPISPNAMQTVILCPSITVRAFIIANQLPQRFGVVALPPIANEHVQPWLQAVRTRRLPVYVLHEASVNGCLLMRDVYQLWQLSPDHPVIDLGINPRDVNQKTRVLKMRPDPKLLDKVTTFSRLQPHEIKWLRQENVAPLHGLPPTKLLALLLTGKRVAQVGFMSWPKASSSAA